MGTITRVSPYGGAVFSSDGLYRYRLWRSIGSGRPSVAFIGLNPSTADEWHHDRTVWRCIDFARRWRFKHFEMLNAFSVLSTNPSVLRDLADPVGPENDGWLCCVAEHADVVVAAWGNHAELHGRSDGLRAMLAGREIHHLGLTKRGHPSHPLYMRRDTTPQPW
jgi:hypothetical protein